MQSFNDSQSFDIDKTEPAYSIERKFKDFANAVQYRQDLKLLGFITSFDYDTITQIVTVRAYRVH